MPEKNLDLKKAVRDIRERIETERYNSGDPVLSIAPSASHEEVIIKLIAAERTGAPLKLGKKILYPAEDQAIASLRRGVQALNSWLFRTSSKHFAEAARLAHDPILQQRINLYRQLQLLLQAVVRSSPDKILRSKGSYFQEIIDWIPKYDKLSSSEQKYYRDLLDSVYELVCRLDRGDLLALSQPLIIRCSVSLSNSEYLASYIWLYKTYLLNKEAFDALAAKDKLLNKAFQSLKTYLEVETELVDKVDESPTVASPYDLQDVFVDQLTVIFNLPFFEDAKEKFAFPLFKES